MDLKLKLAIRLLQHLAVYSRCWTSRQMALLGLRAIGMEGDIELGPQGLPVTVELSPEERPDVRHPGVVGNYLNMWGE